MSKIEMVRVFLEAVGMPKKQQADVCCYAILAMAGIKPRTPWRKAENTWIRIHDIIQFINQFYKTTYAENSRETFRKQAMHAFRSAAIIEDNGLATNSPNYKYRLTEETLSVLQCLDNEDWRTQVNLFLTYHEKLVDIYASKKTLQKQPVRINNVEYLLSAGKHNVLQKAIIEGFVPRFATQAECLYLGDTTNKDLVKNVDMLSSLGFSITLHDKMPDVILYDADKKWLYFIEAVTSVGPMNPKRILELNELTKNVAIGKVYLTAFLDFKTFKRFADDLAWDTEVWIAEAPDHMIHLNGDRFYGPR